MEEEIKKTEEENAPNKEQDVKEEMKNPEPELPKKR